MILPHVLICDPDRATLVAVTPFPAFTVSSGVEEIILYTHLDGTDLLGECFIAASPWKSLSAYCGFE
jgi:hypothetical protein